MTSATPIEDAPAWQRTLRTWREAAEVSSGKRGPYPFTATEKQDLLAHLGQAADDVGALAAESRMSLTEAELLGKEIALMVETVAAKRTKEERELSCYKPVLFVPERDSLERLAERVPLLERLASEPSVQPAAIEKIVAAISRETATLEDEDALVKLSGEERKQAVDLRDRALELLGALKRPSKK
jgi:hypothetical protein